MTFCYPRQAPLQASLIKMKKNKGNGWIMVDQQLELNLQYEMVTSDKTLVYYSELLKNNFKEINNTVF
jgi:hypothetical protein